MNFTSGAGPKELLSLDNIREQLIRLEDTIIFLLIERAQFAHNPLIYKAGAFKEDLAWDGTWLEWFLLEIESFHAKARRYTSPDEHPFNDPSKLPQPIIPTLAFPSLLHVPAATHPSAKVNDQILDFYVKKIVPAITTGVAKTEDDGNYGSAATRDVEVLQALSRRIHFGMFVSESKFLSAPKDFIPHIQSSPPNREALAGLITKPEVERRLLIRLGNKARLYGGELDAEGKFVPPPPESESASQSRGKIDVDQVVGLYRDHVIPLTKDVEVEYLVHRLDGLSAEDIEKLQQ